MSFLEIMKADAPHIPLNSYTIAKIDSSDHAINLLLVNGSKLNDNFKKMLGDGVLEMVTENLNNDKQNVVLGGVPRWGNVMCWELQHIMTVAWMPWII